MARIETPIRDAAWLEAAIEGLAEQIAASRTPGAPLRLVGIRTRGVPIANRIAEHLRDALGDEVPVGAVDITLYRDDLLGRRERWPVLRGTEIAFPVDGAEIVLVDDVLYTGRTVRAALNTICDLGRPARVRLAVVAVREGRELPLQADYAAVEVEAGPEERVLVRVAPMDDEPGIVRVTSS